MPELSACAAARAGWLDSPSIRESSPSAPTRFPYADTDPIRDAAARPVARATGSSESRSAVAAPEVVAIVAPR